MLSIRNGDVGLYQFVSNQVVSGLEISGVGLSREMYGSFLQAVRS